MIKRTRLIAASATCTDCEWRSSRWRNAQACAARHAAAHRHVVYVEVALSSVYDGRRDRRKSTAHHPAQLGP